MLRKEHSFENMSTSVQELASTLKYVEQLSGSNTKLKLITLEASLIAFELSNDVNHKTIEQWLTDLSDLVKYLSWFDQEDEDEEEGYKFKLYNGRIEIKPAYWMCGK